MPISRHALSTAYNHGTSWSPVLPSGITAGMLIVVPLANKLSTQAPTMVTSGYTKGGEFTGGAGADGEDSGPIRITVWYKIAEGNESNETLSITAPSATGNNGVCRPVVYSKDDGSLWDIAFATGKDDTGSSTLYLATSSTSVDMTTGDWVVCFTAQTDGTQSSSATSGTGVNGQPNNTRATGFTFSGLAKPMDNRSTGGNNSSLLATEATIASGSGSAQVTTQFSFAAAPATSAGVSGATVFMRLNEWEPTDPTVRGIGAAGEGTSSATIPYPASLTINAGDIILLNVASKNQQCRPKTPSGLGFIRVKESLSSHDSNGSDLGPVNFNTWYKIADGTESGSVTVDLEPSSQANSISGQIIVLSRDAGANVVIDVVDGGHNFPDHTVNASLTWSAKANNAIRLLKNDHLICVSAANTDAFNYSNLSVSAPGVTFSKIGDLFEQPVTSGNDAEHFAAWWKVTSTGDVLAVPTFTATASGVQAPRRPAGQTHFIRIRQTTSVDMFTPSCAIIMDPQYQDNSDITSRGGVWGYGKVDWQGAINTTTDPSYSIVTRGLKKFFRIKRDFANGVSVADGGPGLPVERRAEYYLKWQPRTQVGTKRHLTWEVEIDSLAAPVLQYIICQDHTGTPDSGSYSTNHPLFSIEICRANQYSQGGGFYAPAGSMIICHNTRSPKYYMATHNNVPYASGGTPILYTGTKRIRVEHMVKYGTSGNGRLLVRITDLTNNLVYTYDDSTAATVALTAAELGSLEMVGGAFKQGAYFHQINTAADCKTMVDNGFSTYAAHYAYWAYAERQPTDFDYADAYDDDVLDFLKTQVS